MRCNTSRLSVCPGLGIATLLIALLVRILFTFVCVLCAGFNMREKVFISLAWMPKATVQVFLSSRLMILSNILLQCVLFLLCISNKIKHSNVLPDHHCGA